MDIPIAPIKKIILPKGKDKYITIYVKCPFCTKEHKHGGGQSLKDISKMFGPRLSHCEKAEHVQYIITEQYEEETLKKSYDPDYIREYHRNYYHKKLKKTSQ
jgi:hypothetical protein